MAIDSYMAFIPYTMPPGSGKGPGLTSESQVDMAQNNEPLATDTSGGNPALPSLASNHQIFEIEDYSFDIEQTLNIGSQSVGAGAGKVTFNPFSITRKIDRASPVFYQMACAGTAFKWVTLALRKSTGGPTSGQVFLRFDFKLVAVKTISWAHDDESPKETVTFEYGGLLVRYSMQNPDGSLATAVPGGWNRVNNKSDQTMMPIMPLST
ncbi:MAG: type VI secretion system tube protein Hcp [Rhodospirillales bacterium]